jgi:hypothetical protein
MNWYKKKSTKPKRKKLKKGQFQPMFRKDPVEMSGLIGGVLKRHNIGKQVNAAMIVTSAHEWLQNNLPEKVRDDVKAHAYQENNLRIACRHAGAMGFVDERAEDLKLALIRIYPTSTIESVHSRVYPAAWGERAW